MADIYVVVGEWRGVVDKVEVYLDKNVAEARKKEIEKEYPKAEGESSVGVWEKKLSLPAITVGRKAMDWIKCGSCGKKFYIPSNYHGVLYCPYCRSFITDKA